MLLMLVRITMMVINVAVHVDDEAVRAAVRLSLDLDLCVPHHCQFGSLVDSRGLQASFARFLADQPDIIPK